MLSEDQKDALREYMNMFIGNAASLLSDMVQKRVNLQIPDIHLLNHEVNAKELELVSSYFNSYVVSSSIEFGTEFNGTAKLIFPKDKIKELVHLCIGDEDEEDETALLTETDFDAIREIGNIILNAVVGSLGNLLEVKLEYSLPEVNILHVEKEFANIVSKHQSYLLVIRNVFAVDETDVEGAIIIVLSMEAIHDLIDKIDEILREVYE
jgi:chemotaxis protein CheC